MDVIDVQALPVDQWLHVVEPEYFAGYVPDGGAGARFVIGDGPALARVQHAAADLALRHRMLAVQASAATAKLHMLQELFFTIACALPWDRLLQTYVEDLFSQNGYAWPQPGATLTMPALAQHYDVAPNLLARNRDQWLTHDLWDDAAMAQDFRSAMLRLCVARLDLDDDAETPILQWLRGEKVGLGLLRQFDIASRINRTNARAMLVSLCHFIRKCGSAGLVLTLDLRPALRPRPEGEGTIRYSPGAVMDLYEVLREIIDDLEHLPGLFLLVLADQALIAGDPKRTLDMYKALEMRIWPDVRPGDQQNPLAPLVTVSA